MKDRFSRSRRSALKLVAGTCAMSALPAWGTPCASRVTDTLARNLARSMSRGDAAAIGRKVVASGVLPDTPGEIAAALLECLDPMLWLDDHADPKRLTSALDWSIRVDFGHAAVTFVDGWMLSRTESLAYALVEAHLPSDGL